MPVVVLLLGHRIPRWRRRGLVGELGGERPGCIVTMQRRRNDACLMMAANMLVKFWGVRGSIPCAGADTLVYGGSTSCVELRCGERTVVLDAGSGLRGFGQQLLLEGRPIDLDLLISHCHVDHFIGLPFFQPAFRPDAKIRLWTGHLQPSYCLEDAIAQLMMPPLFPITPETFKADTEYRDFRAGDWLY